MIGKIVTSFIEGQGPLQRGLDFYILDNGNGFYLVVKEGALNDRVRVDKKFSQVAPKGFTNVYSGSVFQADCFHFTGSGQDILAALRADNHDIELQ